MKHLAQAARSGTAGRRLLPPTLCVCVVLLCASVVVADDSADLRLPLPFAPRLAAASTAPAANSAEGGAYRPAPLVAPEPRSSSSFYRAHLLPRLNYQFDKMAAYQVVPDAGRALGDYVLFDHLTESARARAERATSKAVKNYLLETTEVGQLLQSVRGESGGDGAARAAKPVRLGLSVAHGMPKVDVRYRLSSAIMRVGLGADGSVGLEVYHSQRMTRTRFVARYDADDGNYNMLCRINF